MTLANKITIARILLVPIFVVQVLYYREKGTEWHRWFALGIFLIAALSDALDGWIARHFNQRSRLGTLLDPLADKLLLVAGLILLSLSNTADLATLPLWLVATVLSRDTLLVIGIVVVYFTCGHVAVKPHWLGKAATVLQMGVVILALIDVWPEIRWWTALLAATTTAFSALIYFRDGIQQLNASPHSAPEPPG